MDVGSHDLRVICPLFKGLRLIPTIAIVDYYLFAVCVKTIGCYLTAIRNELYRINHFLPNTNKIPSVEELLDFCQDNGCINRKLEIVTAKLAQKLNISILTIPMEKVNQNPDLINKLIELGHGVIMRMSSPSGKDYTHFVNVKSIVPKGNDFIVNYNETKYEYIEKGESVLLSKINKDKNGEFREVKKGYTGTKQASSGSGGDNIVETFSKLMNNRGFKIGNTIGFAMAGAVSELIEGNKSLTEVAISTGKNLLICGIVNALLPQAILVSLLIFYLLSPLLEKKMKEALKRTVEVVAATGFAYGGMIVGASIGANLGIIGGIPGVLVGGLGGLLGGALFFLSKSLFSKLF